MNLKLDFVGLGYLDQIKYKVFIDRRNIDAILVDFINRVAYNQGLNLDLYIKDLKGE